LRLLRATDEYTYRLFMPAQQGGFWHLWHAQPPLHDRVAQDRYVVPFVNDGRWIVGCPGCGGAQITAPGVDRMFCVDCANEWAGGDYVLVRWTEDHEHAERELEKRNQPHECNWHPDEQHWLELVAENIRFGVGDERHLSKKQQAQVRHHVKEQEAAQKVTVVRIADHLMLPDGTVRTVLTDAGRQLGFKPHELQRGDD